MRAYPTEKPTKSTSTSIINFYWGGRVPTLSNLTKWKKYLEQSQKQNGCEFEIRVWIDPNLYPLLLANPPAIKTKQEGESIPLFHKTKPLTTEEAAFGFEGFIGITHAHRAIWFYNFAGPMENYRKQFPHLLKAYDLFIRHGHFAFASDIARLILLDQQAGFYSDWDMVPKNVSQPFHQSSDALRNTYGRKFYCIPLNFRMGGDSMAENRVILATEKSLASSFLRELNDFYGNPAHFEETEKTAIALVIEKQKQPNYLSKQSKPFLELFRTRNALLAMQVSMFYLDGSVEKYLENAASAAVAISNKENAQAPRKSIEESMLLLWGYFAVSNKGLDMYSSIVYPWVNTLCAYETAQKIIASRARPSIENYLTTSASPNIALLTFLKE